MCFWIERPECGHNDQEFNGLAKVIRIPSTSIVKQQEGIEKIRFVDFVINKILGGLVKMTFPKLY